MIHLTDKIWIGGSKDWVNTQVLDIEAILNVAVDLRGHVGWPDIEYMQVGLVDGPGNPLTAYYAAVLALASLLERHNVLVCCHSGSRSLSVVVMYLAAISGRGWEDILQILQERVDIDLPTIHQAHRLAFDKIDWSHPNSIMERQ